MLLKQILLVGDLAIQAWLLNDGIQVSAGVCKKETVHHNHVKAVNGGSAADLRPLTLQLGRGDCLQVKPDSSHNGNMFTLFTSFWHVSRSCFM